MNDESLRLLTREAIRSGMIPNRRPERVWGGPGGNERCSICNGTVGQLGLFLEFMPNRGEEYPVHIACFAAWKLECQEGPVESRPSAEPPVAVRRP